MRLNVESEKQSQYYYYFLNYAMNLCIKFDIIFRTETQNNKSDFDLA